MGDDPGGPSVITRLLIRGRGHRSVRDADVRERFADATFSALKMLRC